MNLPRGKNLGNCPQCGRFLAYSFKKGVSMECRICSLYFDINMKKIDEV